MADSRKQKSNQKTLKSQPRGRSGGRGAAAGFRFQDIYVAWQLAKMLMQDIDPIIEVFWEKKAIDAGETHGVEPVFIDDAIVKHQSGKWIYTQVKETAPSSGGWSVRNLIQTGVADQLWKQWRAKQPEDRKKTFLQLASGGSVSILKMVNDAALRARTSAEMLRQDASDKAAAAIKELSEHLSLPEDDPLLLEFLRAIRGEQLPDATELYGLIFRSLFVFGQDASRLADHLVRIVADSKHIAGKARSSHTRDSLLEQLQTEGFPESALAGAGLIVIGTQPDESFWRDYRAEVVKSLQTFRLYGLDVQQPVLADLPSLFVPLKFLPLDDQREDQLSNESKRRSLIDTLEEGLSEESDLPEEPEGACGLGELLTKHRRFVLVGMQGCGKTTTLRWLAIIAALEGEEGTRVRKSLGLPAEPLLPVFVRFRRLAERIKSRNLQAVAGRVRFVADYLSAEFQAGVGKHVFDNTQSLRYAYDLLQSKNTLLLFDALDEVGDETIRNQLLQTVTKLLEDCSEPRVVLSSRPYALRKEDIKAELPRYAPLPLDPEATGTFCQQWYQAVRVHLSNMLDKREATQRGVHLAGEAKRVPDFAQSPLLLSILALVHFNQEGNVPVERAKLYDYATTAILGHWERDPARNPGDDGIPSNWATTLGLEDADIHRVVERLAHDVQMSEAGSECSMADAIDSLRDGITATSRQLVSSDDLPRLLLRLLENRAGLVQERTVGIYAFVHLGFQEYLAARFFVSQGKDFLANLAKQADEERHAEVIRFVVGILSSDHSEAGVENTRNFVLAVAERNPALAGACLLEASYLEIEAKECEELARAVWTDGWHYFHHRTDIMARIVWALLERTEDADQLLLELIAQDDQSRRHPMRFETTFALLASRPARPMTSQLQWFLRRLSKVKDDHGPRVTPICELILVEAGAEPVADHVSGLIELLRPTDMHFDSRNARSILISRAENQIREGIGNPDSAEHVMGILYNTLLNTPDSSKAPGAARLLLSIGEPLTDEFAEALVKCALGNKSNSDFRSWIVALVSAPQARELLFPRLVRSLTDAYTHAKGYERDSLTRFLKELGIDATQLLSLRPDTLKSSSAETLAELVVEDSNADDIAKNLEGELWLDAVEDDDRIWNAALALVAAKRTEVSGLPRALVRAGLASSSRRESAVKHLRQIREKPESVRAVRASLLDVLEAENNALAAAAAGTLMDMGDATGKARVKRIVKAALRDEKQVPEMTTRLKRLLSDEHHEAVIEAVSDFLKDEPDTHEAGSLALLLADAGHLNAPHVATGLALGGLLDPNTQDNAFLHLKAMLDDSELVTDAREALSRALEDFDRQKGSEQVSWGAVKCLWDYGMHFEPGLLRAIIGAGLESKNEARAQEARKMVAALIQEPLTTSSTVAGLLKRITDALRWREKHFDEAWPAAECLLKAGVFNHEKLPDVLVYGGLKASECLDRLFETVRPGVVQSNKFAEAVEKNLWATVSNGKDAWRAVEMLNTLFRSSLDCAMKDDGDRRQKVIRVLLGEAEEHLAADSLLAELSRDEEVRTRIYRTLVRLLQDKEKSIAFSAACRLAEQNELEHMTLPRAVIQEGFSKATKTEKALQLLNEIRTKPSMCLPLRAALSDALWDSDPQTSWNAAAYLLDCGEGTNPGIARALVHGGFSHGWRAPRADAQRRLRAMLVDPNTRNTTEEALISSLFIPDEGRRLNFEVASLLTSSGFDTSEALVLTVDEDIRWLAAPVLALISLSGRIDKTVEAAKRLGSRNLLSILEQ